MKTGSPYARTDLGIGGTCLPCLIKAGPDEGTGGAGLPFRHCMFFNVSGYIGNRL
jgi:hypothetical protein